jgi:hypothetical protein
MRLQNTFNSLPGPVPFEVSIVENQCRITAANSVLAGPQRLLATWLITLVTLTDSGPT